MNQTQDRPTQGYTPGMRRGGGKEPFEVILRRFNREVMQSGLMTEVKKRRFREKDLSRVLRRKIAVVKAARRKVKRGY